MDGKIKGFSKEHFSQIKTELERIQKEEVEIEIISSLYDGTNYCYLYKEKEENPTQLEMIMKELKEMGKEIENLKKEIDGNKTKKNKVVG